MENVPKHIAIIMDGNGRWAKNRFLPRTVGHSEGAKTLKKILIHAQKLGVKYLTVYAFSTENWKRATEEVSAIMTLFKTYINSEEKSFMENNVRFRVSGREENVSPELLKAIRNLEEKTSNNSGITLNMAFNYGGRAEILDAVNKLLKSGKEWVDEKEFVNALYAGDIPDPELLIRTSGELRVSNFLLWQIAYSEIVITDKLWPDFSEKDLEESILKYNSRNRRFGGV